MGLFNRRNQDDPNVPQEVQSYYQAEKRERTGIAWMLALGTLVATVILAIGLYFGGRWLYRTVFGSNDSKTTQQTGTDSSEREAEEEGGKPGASDTEQTPSTPESDRDTTPTDENQPGGTTADDNQPAQNTTPRTGPLPTTGPEDNL